MYQAALGVCCQCRYTCAYLLWLKCSAGTQSAGLSQGVFEAAGRRYGVVWKMVNEVLILSLVPLGTNLLTAQRLNGAVSQLLLLYCKSTAAVTMDKIFRKYVQVCCTINCGVMQKDQ